jgi:hypothetical protein
MIYQTAKSPFQETEFNNLWITAIIKSLSEVKKGICALEHNCRCFKTKKNAWQSETWTGQYLKPPV